MKTIELIGVEKEFKKGVKVLKGISLSVNRNEVLGLVGPNGSGKTTTLRIIATLLKPTRGNVYVYEHSVLEEADSVRRLLSYLPEEAGVYERLTGWENLFYYAVLYAGNWMKAKEIAGYGAKLSGLGEDINRIAGEYSRGMKRRLTLARTLMVKPKITLLDEATTGLDVFSAVGIRKTIRQYTEKYETTIIFSSHNMLEIEHLCDRVAFILNGEIVTVGKPIEIIEEYNANNLEEAFVNLVKKRGVQTA